VFNIAQNKQISGFRVPQELIIAFNYITPRIHGTTTAFRALSWASRDWTLGGVLRYQSGQLLQTPPSANNLLANLQRGPSNNPALWGGGYTFMDKVPGQPLFLVNPNSKFDPTTQEVLNPAAWTEAPFGTFGTSAAYYNDFRWQRQRAESLAFGRTFSIKEKYKLQVRAEFQTSSTACSIPCRPMAPRSGQRRVYHLSHRPQQQLERHRGSVVLRVWVCSMAERHRFPAAKRADSSTVYVLILDDRAGQTFPGRFRSVV
jgi:hypothetical protein